MSGDFKLVDFLKNDLLRAYYLTSLDNNRLSGIKLWVGLFSPRFAPVLIYRLSYFFLGN